MKSARLMLLAALWCAVGCDHAGDRDAGRAGEYTTVLAGSAPRGAQQIVSNGCRTSPPEAGNPQARGRVGPPLDFFAERSFIGGELPNTPDTLVRWIMDPPGQIPATAMPRMNVSERDARDIAAYLYSLH